MGLQRTFCLAVPAERARRSMTRALDLASSSRVRVPVAVVFADLSDFVAWTAAHGDAAAVDLMSFNALTVVPIVDSHDGHVVKHLGDGFMLAFRDPQQAVLAAVEISCAVSDVLPLRVGGHWGQPIATGRDLIGHDVNIAARTVAKAAPGEVLITSQLWTAARDTPGVRYGEPVELQAKGLRDPVVIRRAHRTHVDPRRSGRI